MQSLVLLADGWGINEISFFEVLRSTDTFDDPATIFRFNSTHHQDKLSCLRNVIARSSINSKRSHNQTELPVRESGRQLNKRQSIQYCSG